MDYNKQEIIEQLEKQSNLLQSWFLDNPIEKTEFAPEGAWTAGQHLLHMIKSTKPLATGLGYPRFILRLKFGKSNRPSASFDGVIKKYQDALANGGKAMGVYVPREVKSEERDKLVSRFNGDVQLLISNLRKWPEESLDKLVVPHPLIGNLTVREMMYFAIYHTEHHFKILQERYS